MKINDINFSNFVVDKHLRADSKFHNFYNERGWNIFNVPDDEKIRLGEFYMKSIERKKWKKGKRTKVFQQGKSI